MAFRRFLFTPVLAAALLAVGGLYLLAQSKPGADIPPFTIKGDLLDLDTTAGKYSYEGNVVFTSSRNETTITCGRMEANAASAKKVTSVSATRDVVVTMTIAMQRKSAAGVTETVPYRVTAKGPAMVYDMGQGDAASLKLTGAGGARPTVTAVETTPGAGDKDTVTMTADTVVVFTEATKVAAGGNGVTLLEASGAVVLTGGATILDKAANDKPVRYDMTGKAATCLYRLEPTAAAGNPAERVVTLKGPDDKAGKASVAIRKTDPATREELDVYDLEGSPITYNLNTGGLKAGAASTTHGGGDR
jgi:lipopolysaccharide export system protein LptA